MKMQSKWDNQREDKLARIIKMELEIIEAIRNGHKSADNDEFKSYREEMNRLRIELKLK
jgi:hypothetical protein